MDQKYINPKGAVHTKKAAVSQRRKTRKIKLLKMKRNRVTMALEMNSQVVAFNFTAYRNTVAAH